MYQGDGGLNVKKLADDLSSSDLDTQLKAASLVAHIAGVPALAPQLKAGGA